MSLRTVVEKALERLRIDPNKEWASPYVLMLETALEASEGPSKGNVAVNPIPEEEVAKLKEEFEKFQKGPDRPGQLFISATPTYPVYDQGNVIDYDKRLAQALQKRSRREAEERATIEGSRSHVYIIRNGPDAGDHVSFDSPLADSTTIGGRRYTVKGMYLELIGE